MSRFKQLSKFIGIRRMWKSVNITFKIYKTQIGFVWILYPELNLVGGETKENSYI